jgi:hypothetical protein
MYDELVYFEGAHFAHICAYREHMRLRRLKFAAAESVSRTRYSLPYLVYRSASGYHPGGGSIL